MITESTAISPALTSDETRALLARTMGLVAATAGAFTIGAYRRASRRQGTRPAVAATGGADKQLHLLPQPALWVARGLGVSQAKIDTLSAR